MGGLALIVMLALNLRPLIASISPLQNVIRDDTGMSFQSVGLLTTLPFLCMGLVALISARLAARVGETRGVSLGLMFILLGCLIRILNPSAAALLATALVGGIGIAIIQTLLPGRIKRDFSRRVPLAMGVYSAALMSGGGLAAWISPRIAGQTGSWSLGVGLWFIPALIALAGWLWKVPQTRGSRSPVAANRLWYFPRAWVLALYFGVINAGYSSVIAWLPAYYQHLGWSSSHSGSLLAWMTMFQVLAALVMPALAQRQSGTDRRLLLGISLLAQLIGYLGLILLPGPGALIWVAIAGFGLGACFALGLILALDHHPDPRIAGQLAAFMQGIGFIINATSPWISGALREATGGFIAVWIMLALGVSAMIGLTLIFRPSRYETLGLERA
ncbi:CynX/NimT family MFS transporter [Halomonas sp. GXIMD04776]|uniref:CynX/NimT family MFS transporter n=1 Tax=Halomonas sp. GXIMD04776 TaxID=3415605 RepID=UPI003CA0EF22